MKSMLIVLAAAGSLMVAGAASAQSAADLEKSKGCTNCHAADTKKVGPSYKDIAAKNQGKTDALVAKLKEGKGHPKVNATDAELKTLVNHVLATK